MFRATLLPYASVYGSSKTVKDVCVWGAVDDEMWNVFAGAQGDASLQNLSLLASMQPADIEEAIEATTTGAVGRTKLRLVYAAARLKFDLDPIDVGAPPPTVPVEPVVGAPRGVGTPSLKVKVASVLDQASDREVETLPLEVLRKLRARFRAVEGEDRMKAEEVWRPCGQLAAGTFGRRSWRTRSWTTSRSVHWFTRRLGEVGTRKRSVAGRDLRRVPRRSSEGVLEANTHGEEAMDVIAPLRLESNFASNSIGMLVECSGECPTKRAHVCEFCLEPHRTVECPNNPVWRPPKSSGMGKHKGER